MHYVYQALKAFMAAHALFRCESGHYMSNMRLNSAEFTLVCMFLNGRKFRHVFLKRIKQGMIVAVQFEGVINCYYGLLPKFQLTVIVYFKVTFRLSSRDIYKK